MINQQVIKVMQGINEVSNQVVMEYPITTISNPAGDINGIVNLDLISEEFMEFGIWDLSSFLSSLSVLEDPEIKLDNNIISAKDEYSNIEYVTSNPSILESCVCDPRIITSTIAAEAIVEVDLDVETITRIKKGCNIFKTLKDLQFSLEDGKLVLNTMNKETFQSSSNSFSTRLECNKASGNFKLVIPNENFLKVPLMDYKLRIYQNGSEYRIAMVNDLFQWVLSLKK